MAAPIGLGDPPARLATDQPTSVIFSDFAIYTIFSYFDGVLFKRIFRRVCSARYLSQPAIYKILMYIL